jgi:hypothetical protein
MRYSGKFERDRDAARRRRPAGSRAAQRRWRDPIAAHDELDRGARGALRFTDTLPRGRGRQPGCPRSATFYGRRGIARAASCRVDPACSGESWSTGRLTRMPHFAAHKLRATILGIAVVPRYDALCSIVLHE